MIKDTGPNAINVWKNVWQCSTDTPPVESDGGAVSVYIVYIMPICYLLSYAHNLELKCLYLATGNCWPALG